MKDYKSHSDHELWQLIKINDRQAFETIYRRHWGGLMMSAYNLLGDKETCRDILQDVFADLLSKRKSTFIDSLSGYLKVAVRNRVFRHLRNGAITRKHLDRLEKIAFVDATEQMVNFNLMTGFGQFEGKGFIGQYIFQYLDADGEVLISETVLPADDNVVFKNITLPLIGKFDDGLGGNTLSFAKRIDHF